MNEATDCLWGLISLTDGGPTGESRSQGAQRAPDLDRTGPGYRYAATTPPGRLIEQREPAHWLACVGAPYDAARADGDARAAIAALMTSANAVTAGGEFAAAHYDADKRTLILATDLFGSVPLYYRASADTIAFSTDIGRLPGCQPGGRTELDQQSIYDYLFFSVVPGERSIFQGIRKVPPASRLIWRSGRLQVQRYWTPGFGERKSPDAGLRDTVRESIRRAVARVADGPGVGCFLSGGLDSSTVCGMAARSRRQRTAAFTIGFDVPQFDETRFARISAQHFRLELHERRVRATDVSACVGRVVAAFPEPFGNPSAIPAYLCAHFARETGIRRMLAGDGGDELFGGNERYQKQQVFGLYGQLPGALRHGVLGPLAALSASLPGPFRKIDSYVRQAQVPLPDRLFGYNLLVRNPPAAVLTDEFLASVDPDSPHAYARRVFHEPAQGDVLDRLLYLDWQITLTDNDLTKVRVASQLAGVSVHFPLLDPDVVVASTRIPSQDKLSLRTLRKYYKEAFADFLPPEVLRKPKHGFGVPVGIWVNTDAGLGERVRDRLGSFSRRGIVRPQVIEMLLDLQAREHASYYGALLWPLFTLEEWLQSRGFTV